MGCYPDSEHKKETLFWSLVSKSQELSEAKMTCAMFSTRKLFSWNILLRTSNFSSLKSSRVVSRFVSFRFCHSMFRHFEIRFFPFWGDQVPQALEPAMPGVPRWSPGLRAWSATSRRTVSESHYVESHHVASELSHYCLIQYHIVQQYPVNSDAYDIIIWYYHDYHFNVLNQNHFILFIAERFRHFKPCQTILNNIK